VTANPWWPQVGPETFPRRAPVAPEPEEPCGSGYDLCGECMKRPGRHKHMIVPGLHRAGDPR
jgi:hypothetical protein